jgi:hypothetical protein
MILPVCPSRPIIKSRHFMPNPVAVYGIPSFADGSIKGRKVIGTTEWEQWWDEQFHYCKHGYNTGGIWIPGRYYYYLNFCYISTLGRGVHHPDYVDLDLEFFYAVEEAKHYGKGIIAPKARRKGLSEKTGSIVGHGIRFQESYKAGVCAGLKTYVKDFIDKFNYNDSLIAPELKLKRLENNADDIEFGWKEKEDTGYVECGSRNKIFLRTMFHDPNLFKGTMLNDVVFEEVGEFDLVDETLDATKPCFMVGELMVGTPYIYGTGNKQAQGTKKFAELWHNSDALKLIRFFVPGRRMYFPYVVNATSPLTGTVLNPDGTRNECIPNLTKYELHERVGMEDDEAAQVAIDAEIERLSKLPDKTKLINFKQNYPSKVEEVFIRSGGNDFPTELLNEQGFMLGSLGYNKYKHYSLEYVLDDKGQKIVPYQIKATPLSDKDLENKDKVDESIMMLPDHPPRKHFRNLHVAGIDSYDLDQSKTSKSLGSMVVKEGAHNIPGVENNLPVALIRCRPREKEKFYELCLKTSIYFNLIGNTLIDVAKSLIINHYKQNGGEIYLAKRPLKFESDDSTQQHEYGIAFTRFSKPKLIGMAQTYLSQNTHKIYFPHIISDALDYDEKQIDSDWDSMDALMIALAQEVSLGFTPVDQTEEEKDDQFSLNTWHTDNAGNLVAESDKSSSTHPDPFMRFVETGKF